MKSNLLDLLFFEIGYTEDVVVSENVITSRANGYVDFAIEVAKKLNLFANEKDLQETIAFWRGDKRMQ